MTPTTPHSDNDSIGTDTNRRQFLKNSLIVTAGCFVTALPLSALAQNTASQGDPILAFIRITQTITEHKQINAELAAHFYNAFVKRDATFAQQLQPLAQLITTDMSAQALVSQAQAAGVQTLLQQIVTAWYTGTVGDDYHGTLVSYQQALMYRTVSDGLVVPTYCGNGPLWWTAPVPDADSTAVIDAL
ncbi:sugar dehydrogenase complex small subunit [Rosenbergiella australiborealis]|uniref:Dehydrogenase n=1 Tax=Rosenbergiella australiborealis TaxID=1544696 RepID=A0ABS5T2T4_9GAMM|nr:sugar dehydrogenase complex small subunit [Rosenbergiella australiborealis]MBT0726654.1 dehydrogenase [Rosenbergiella australiborealis]